MKPMPRPPYARILFVCCKEREAGRASCANRGSTALLENLKRHVESKGLQDRVRIVRTLCLGLCEQGPNLCVFPENVWYNDVAEADLDEIKRTWIDTMVE